MNEPKTIDEINAELQEMAELERGEILGGADAADDQ